MIKQVLGDQYKPPDSDVRFSDNKEQSDNKTACAFALTSKKGGEENEQFKVKFAERDA